MTTDLASRVRAARAMRYSDRERAASELHAVANVAIDASWGASMAELAAHAYEAGDLVQAESHARSVLGAAAERADETSRARAGLILVEIQHACGRPIEVDLVRRCADALERAGEYTEAAHGASTLAGRAFYTGDRTTARSEWERAVDLFERGGSSDGGAGVLARLAQLAIEEGRVEDAKECLDRGIGWLRNRKHASRLAHRTERRMTALRASLSGSPMVTSALLEFPTAAPTRREELARSLAAAGDVGNDVLAHLAGDAHLGIPATATALRHTRPDTAGFEQVLTRHVRSAVAELRIAAIEKIGEGRLRGLAAEVRARLGDPGVFDDGTRATTVGEAAERVLAALDDAILA
ncbi:MAG: hypothetical protein K8W52_20275 [Deltaproteobacteria bacterium]|nr:hypothetical protein [Deltaproteobacteria bacterium]